MAENKEYVTHSDEKGSVNISEDVICVIAAAAVADIEGVAGFVSQGKDLGDMLGKKNISKGVKVDIKDDNVTVNTFVSLRQGYPVAETAQAVQEAVKNAVESMTGLSVPAVNVTVCGIVFGK